MFTVDTQEEDSHLVATLLPKTSTFLPRVPHRKLDYFYPYECFRLACEQLFGHVPCYVQYSDVVPRSEFEDEDSDMVVTLVSFYPHCDVTQHVTGLCFGCRCSCIAGMECGRR